MAQGVVVSEGRAAGPLNGCAEGKRCGRADTQVCPYGPLSLSTLLFSVAPALPPEEGGWGRLLVGELRLR